MYLLAIPLFFFLVACTQPQSVVDIPVNTPPKIIMPARPGLMSAYLTDKSTPAEVELAHVTDIEAVTSYASEVTEITNATQSQ